MKTIDFTLEGYTALLARFFENGYRVRQFSDVVQSEADLVLRHDVDFSLDAALSLAMVEAEHDCKATYFVLLRSEFYNLLSAKNKSTLHSLKARGHEIGLHFDAALYENDLEALSEAAEFECGILQDILGQRIEVISFHRPNPALLGLSDTLAGRIHAYQPKFFNEMGYCSDSRGAWHHGHPLEHHAVSERTALQLLTHPIWWTGSSVIPECRLRNFLIEQTRHLDAELAVQCEPHKAGTLKIIQEPTQ